MDERRGATDGARLVALLTEQRDLYRRLRELSDRQRALISGDRPEQLLGILQERQALIAALTRLNGQLAPFRRDWDGTYAGLPEDTRAQTSQLLQEINSLLRVILRTDREDSALLSARKQTVAKELSGLSGGQSATSAYSRHAGAAARRPAADLTG